MPALKQRLRSETPEGYAAQEQSTPTPPPIQEPGRLLGADVLIRCPLPPFNATVDTLRQFDENGKIPARRVIPLPQLTGMSGSTTIINNTSVTSQSGGGSGNAPVTVAAKTVTIPVPTLAPGDAATLTVAVTAVAVLMIVGSSDLCEVRLYGDALTQSTDLPRLTDTAPPFEVTQGLTTDVVLDTTPLQYNWQNRLFVNQDAPVTKNMYVTILNPTLGAVTPTVTITYLPLE
jgi:hypothetical protein